MPIDSKAILVEKTTFSVSIINNNIVYILFKNDIHIALQDVKDSFEIYLEYTKNKACKILVEFPEYTTISKEAREYGAATEITAIAEAFVLRSMSQRILARFFALMHKKEHPLKFFNLTETALNWLIKM